MGGGRRQTKEAKKSQNLALETNRSRAVEGAGGGGSDRMQALCARPRVLAFRIKPGTSMKVGAKIRVVAGVPPALLTGRMTVGWLTDTGQVPTVDACLDDGYQLVGDVEAFDAQLGEGFASVSGFKS